MSTPTQQEIAIQLESLRIAIAARDHTIAILTRDLAGANVKAAEDAKTIADLQTKPTETKPE